MEITKIIKSILIVLLLILGCAHIAYGTWWYGNDIVEGEAGCEEPEPEVVVVEEWCTDPFFQDIEKKHIQEDTKTYDNLIPLPGLGSSDHGSAESAKKISFKDKIRENNTDNIQSPGAVSDSVQEPIVPTVVIQEEEVKVVEKIKEVVPVVIKEVENIEEIEVEVEVEAKQEDKNIHSAFDIISVEQSRSYIPLVLSYIDTTNDVDSANTLIEDLDIISDENISTNTEHASALENIPVTLWAADIRNKHLREIIFISFLIFILFTTLFI